MKIQDLEIVGDQLSSSQLLNSDIWHVVVIMMKSALKCGSLHCLSFLFALKMMILFCKTPRLALPHLKCLEIIRQVKKVFYVNEWMIVNYIIYFELQGVSVQSEQSKLALRDRNIKFQAMKKVSVCSLAMAI